MQDHCKMASSRRCDRPGLALRGKPAACVAAGNSRHATGQAASDPMGPCPGVSVQVFTDLGLSSSEIAHYFGVTEQRVRLLRSGLNRADGKTRMLEIAELVRDKMFEGTFQ